MELTRIEDLFNTEFRCKYKIDISPIAYCKEIFTLESFRIKTADVTVTKGKSKVSHHLSINSFEQLKNTKNVARCSFEGSFEGCRADICVNFEPGSITITAKESAILAIAEDLQGVTGQRQEDIFRKKRMI